jgi:hypothetical protein
MATADTKVSWIAVADEAVGLAKNADEARRQVNVLKDARSDLARLIEDFGTLADGVIVVRPFRWEGKSPSPELARDLSEAVETLDSRPLNRLVTNLERYRGDVYSALNVCWGAHASQQLGDVSELLSLAETLAEVEGITDLSQRLQAALGELARTQDLLPSLQTAELLKLAVASLRKLEASLQPDSVRTFLSAVAHGGASIELLGSDVNQWLKSHNALGRFRVVAGPPTDAADV